MSTPFQCLTCANRTVFDIPYVDVTRTLYDLEGNVLNEESVGYSPSEEVKIKCSLCQTSNLNIYQSTVHTVDKKEDNNG